MLTINNDIVKSIQDKHIEVHYNQRSFVLYGKTININMQGKIFCPLLNCKISSLTCSKLMEYEGWPRAIDAYVCDNIKCKIYKSIKKNVENKHEKNNSATKVVKKNS